MATAVAVYYRCFCSPERIERIIEHGIHPRRVRARSNRPAHYLAIKTVDNRRQIDLTSRQMELGDIGQPLFIWSAGTKIAVEQILGAGLISPQ